MYWTPLQMFIYVTMKRFKCKTTYVQAYHIGVVSVMQKVLQEKQQKTFGKPVYFVEEDCRVRVHA